MTNDNKWWIYQFSFLGPCDNWWRPVDDPFDPWWWPIDDPDDNSDILLMTLRKTDDYLIITSYDDTDDPHDKLMTYDHT